MIKFLKRKKIIIGVIIFIFMIVGYFKIFINLTDKKGTGESIYDVVLEKIKNKESFLLYITNDDPYQCSNCSAINNIIDFYNEVYSLNFIEFNSNKNSDNLKKINNLFDFPLNYLTNPAVIIVKDGVIQAVANEMSNDIFLKQYLADYGFIEKKSLEIETNLNTEELFDSVYNQEKNSLIVIGSSKIKFKKKLYEMALKNNFNYYVIYAGVMNYYKAYNTLSTEVGYYLTTPSFVVVSSGKVVDYTKEIEEDRIKEFLTKNKIIS